jgi:Do/DeqQ family serine protease
MKSIKLILLSFISGIGGAWFYFNVLSNERTANNDNLQQEQPESSFVKLNADTEPVTTNDNIQPITEEIELPEEDFTVASAKSTQSVVYIKTISEAYRRMTWMDMFFGGYAPKEYRVGSGSGVIYSEDGYIITNNHVIDDGDKIEVIVGKQSYEASIIGVDPSTDLAVLKIPEKGLPAIEIGRSSDVEVGEWVIAVGNPFNLTSTVTAGIVSAKGRDINILEGNFPIESFIQTDAAINPGNSGGALVNKKGQLVGINTAILSQTGSYTGYGFAVPIDIARKVTDDIIAYGEVQKAYWGAAITDLDYKIAEKLDLSNADGVLVTFTQPGGAAAKAGIKQGDIINSFNGEAIDSKAEFEEMLSYFSPGERIKLAYKRDNTEKEVELVLTNKNGTTSITRKESFFSQELGVEFEQVPKVEKDLYGIQSGIRVNKIEDRGLFRQLDIPEGYIITKINNNPMNDPEELSQILSRIRGRVLIEVVNQRGRRNVFSYYF